jgi:hypothetical protein
VAGWAVVVVVGLALFASGCSGDDDDPPAATATTTTTSSSTSTTSTTTEPAAFPSDAAAYTGELVRAWGVGDRTEAARFASPSAVDALFAFADPGGPRWDLQGVCEGAGGTTYCSYRDPERNTVVLLGIPVANGNRIDGPHEVGSALFQPG